MKKYIILSLFTVSSAFTYTMEEKSFFGSIVSYVFSVPGWFLNRQGSKESLMISSIRKDMNDFENQFTDKLLDELICTVKNVKVFLLPFNIHTIETGILSFNTDAIETGTGKRTESFLHYCYFDKYVEDFARKKNFNNLDLNPAVLHRCLNANIKGYSALGAAMIAKDESFEERRILAQKLINLGFKPTEKDIAIAQLYLYDNIPVENQKIFRHLIHQSSTAHWIILPKDVRLSIMHYIIQMFKNEFWFLSGFNS